MVMKGRITTSFPSTEVTEQSPEPLPAAFARSSSAFRTTAVRAPREEHERPAQQGLLMQVLHVHGLETKRHRQLQLDTVAFLPRPADRRERSGLDACRHTCTVQDSTGAGVAQAGIRTYSVVSTGDDADTSIVTLLSNGYLVSCVNAHVAAPSVHRTFDGVNRFT